MTDIITSEPLPLRSRLSNLRFPKLNFPVSIPAVFARIGEAFELAYVAPYQAKPRDRFARGEAESEERDPDW